MWWRGRWSVAGSGGVQKRGQEPIVRRQKRGQVPIVRSTLRAFRLLVPDPFSDAAEHPSGHLAIGS